MTIPLLSTSLLPKENASLLIAFSGGLDSTVLLHLLHLWQKQFPTVRLHAIYIDHGLSPKASQWAAHCRVVCQAIGVSLIVRKVTIDNHDKGVEASARQARYDAFSEVLQPNEYLVTAQHSDDQSETFLLALKRGSGPAGLASMPMHRLRGANIHLRPLLLCSREQLLCWAKTHALSWVEDESNDDQRYDRNFVRHTVMPAILARWPHFNQSVGRSAQLCGEQEQLLDELLMPILQTLIDAKGRLFFTPLLTMSEAQQNALLRRWIASKGAEMPSREMSRRIVTEVMLSRRDAQPSLQLGDYQICRYRQYLYWLPCLLSLKETVLDWKGLSQPIDLPQQLGTLIIKPNGGMIRPVEKHERVTIRFAAQGHYHIVGRSGGRSLKKIWQELQVPPWQRQRIPLIYYDEQLICAPGYFIIQESVDVNNAGWQILWKQAGDWY